MTNILMWDTAPRRRASLARRLGSLGYAVAVAPAEDGLVPAALENRPDLIMVPANTAKTTAHLLRDRFPETPIVGFTPGNHGAINAFRDLDVDGFFSFPARDEEIACRIERALRQRRAISENREEYRRLETIIDITSLTGSVLDPAEILFLIVRKISELIPVTRCSIIRIDESTQEAIVVASHEDAGIRDIHLNLEKYPEIREALRKCRPVLVKDVGRDALMTGIREHLTRLGIRSIVVLPIVFREEIIGTLFLRTSSTGRAFTAHEISLCEAVANSSSNALYNAFLFERIAREKRDLEQLAITDYLTDLYNIRYFYHRMESEFARAERYQTPIACMMLDIDFFKKINDTLGHKQGDAVLREFAQTLKNNIRSSDILARYGGEEFIVLLPQTGLEGARAEGERLRSLISNHRFASMNQERGITMSIGLAVFPHEQIQTADHLISCADEAVYQAKNHGRDRLWTFN